MAQVKKNAVRAAILSSAFNQFSRERAGYTNTTLSRIAAEAGVSTSNIYVYFGSKLSILFAIYDPWLRDRLDRLEAELETILEPRARLHRLFVAIWRDIAEDNNGFANNIMQALSTATPDEGYDRELLLWAEAKVGRMIRGCLPSSRADLARRRLVSQMMFMAFDGFVLNFKLNGSSKRVVQIADLMCDLLLGTPAPETGGDGT